MALEVNGAIVVHPCWLFLAGDAEHINLAELDAVIKGFILALVTDSSCVQRWISDTLTGKGRVKTRAASEN